MEIIKSIVIALGGYIYGSVNFSVLISSIFHKRDIRRTGSGNAGATNMARLFGIKAGLGTMLGDMFKTVLALLTGYFILGKVGICISGIFCLLGHCFPVFYEFRGGKEFRREL
jgi:Predicted membrane protein